MRWLDDDTHALLRSACEPFAKRSCAATPHALLSWSVLQTVLQAVPDAEAFVVARGEVLPLALPRTVASAQHYLDHGVGFRLRRTEGHHEALAVIADELSELGSTHVQLFATPGNSHGLRWHYDDCIETSLSVSVGIWRGADRPESA